MTRRRVTIYRLSTVIDFHTEQEAKDYVVDQVHKDRPGVAVLFRQFWEDLFYKHKKAIFMLGETE